MNSFPLGNSFPTVANEVEQKMTHKTPAETIRTTKNMFKLFIFCFEPIQIVFYWPHRFNFSVENTPDFLLTYKIDVGLPFTNEINK